MEIQHTENNNGGRFYIVEDGNEIAEMTYKLQNDNIMVIDHTEVEKSYRERGIGGKLVKTSVNFARENNRKINPVCPFARDEFNENSSYSDVLK